VQRSLITSVESSSRLPAAGHDVVRPFEVRAELQRASEMIIAMEGIPSNKYEFADKVRHPCL
jgi:hypothetical protein